MKRIKGEVFALQKDILSPPRSDFLKLVALICMSADHIGYVFASQLPPALTTALRAAGRLTYPLFAYQIAVGFCHTKSAPHYLTRLLLFGLLSQLPYELAFRAAPWKPNVFATLALSLAALMLMDACRHRRLLPLGIFLAMLLCVLAWRLRCEYLWYGVAAAAVFYLFRRSPWMCFATQLALSAVYAFWKDWPLQHLAGFAYALILLPLLIEDFRYPIIRLNKWIFYGFYPLHLLVLYGCQFLW